MLVGSRMTHPVITVSPQTTVAAAAEMLQQESIRSMPVVDRQGRLLGMVSYCEINTLKMSGKDPASTEVEEIMQKKILTVTENTPIEEAARMLTDYDLISLPVVRDGFVVGIITTVSMMRILLELTGARQNGIRLTVEINDSEGALLKLIAAIAELGGNINTVSTYCADNFEKKVMTLKVNGVEKFQLKQVILPMVDRLIDIR